MADPVFIFWAGIFVFDSTPFPLSQEGGRPIRVQRWRSTGTRRDGRRRLAVRHRRVEKAGGYEFRDLEQVMMKIRTIEDIDYSDGFAVDDGRRHRQLDLFLPESDRPALPIVVIHGGGWFTQGRKGARERSIATDLANAGFAAASIDYALVNLDSPEKSHGLWPTPLSDCKMAVGFLRKHADEYQIAPERAGAIGGSAGAHLAAMLGASSGNNSNDPALGLDCTIKEDRLHGESQTPAVAGFTPAAISFLRNFGIAPPINLPSRVLPNKCWLTVTAEIPSKAPISHSVLP
jgi:hypothetical protein